MPVPEAKPLVGGIAAVEGPAATTEQDRDEAIIQLLRQKLRERTSGYKGDAKPAAAPPKADAGEEDKYEPQRLSRKICWQYDSTAKKVPLLRRHYI